MDIEQEQKFVDLERGLEQSLERYCDKDSFSSTVALGENLVATLQSRRISKAPLSSVKVEQAKKRMLDFIVEVIGTAPSKAARLVKVSRMKIPNSLMPNCVELIAHVPLEAPKKKAKKSAPAGTPSPISTDKFFSQENCDRCGAELGDSRTLSMFNNETICRKCAEAERKRPDYKKAVDAERAAQKKGDRNFKGIGL